MKTYSIYSQRCLVDGKFLEKTIHISDGKIAKITDGKYTSETAPFIDYGDLIIMPGVIDAHVHINEPGRTNWEGFDSATKAAAIGGITSLIEMPLNASPVTTTVGAFEEKLTATKDKLHVNCGFYGGVIPDNLQQIEGLIQSGVFGIKGFLCHSGIPEFPNVDKQQLVKIAPILKKYNIPLLLHCEIEDGDVPTIFNPKSYLDYLNSRPQRWETNAITVAMDIQATFDCRVHIVHLSASSGLESITNRRKLTKGLTVETCPHYLFFNAEEISDAQPIYKCAPPIREKNNNNMLWEAIKSGQIDFIASDHSPAPAALKKLEEGDFFEAWGGISGLQFLLSAFITKALENELTIESAIEMLTIRPASFLSLDHRKGRLAIKYDADIVVLNEKETFVVSEKEIYHRHKPTPYLGKTLQGRVVDTFVNGARVVKNYQLNQLEQGIVLKNRMQSFE